MAFNTGAALMDALVLSIVAAENTYGYKITQDVRSVMPVSESTLYPVLRRLQKEEYLTAFDRAFSGRNRRYYSITEKGRAQLSQYRQEWAAYRARIDELLLGGMENDESGIS